ncbi:hypothetical protein DXG03_003376 [Asterophora parasitica]|uniref:Phosphatases II n=1 Tax=Asterophora parasitica TaxID=117018 RepID=A0A9P7G3A7_9AGAR|nr:hypothetical protein DXG03_003376 [Asterophora parasitica]
MSISRTPLWLEKHSNESYLHAVYSTLHSRERERELARYLSRQPGADTTPGPPTRRHGHSKVLHRVSSILRSPNPDQSSPTHYSVAVAHRPENRLRNRYMDIHPYDRTRVVVCCPDLPRHEDGEGEDSYLNASWVLERYGHKWWIASQAPLPQTIHTFLSIFLQPTTSPPKSLCNHGQPRPRSSRVRLVIQLTNDVEEGRRKAHPYFPHKVGQSALIFSESGNDRPLKVTLVDRQTIAEAHCVWSTVSVVPVTPEGEVYNDSDDVDSLEQEREPVTFQHMLYTSWPDHGVPKDDDRAGLLAFLRLVDRTNRNTSLDSHPDDPDIDPDPAIIVGCSAGIGRTGSFIALSSLLRHFGFLPPPGAPSPPSVIPPSPLGVLPHALEDDLVVQEVDSLREQRPGMVQREEQTLLIYEILASAFVL